MAFSLRERFGAFAPLAFPCFVLCLIWGGNRRVLDYQGSAGIISIVRWSLRPVIFDVDEPAFSAACDVGQSCEVSVLLTLQKPRKK